MTPDNWGLVTSWSWHSSSALCCLVVINCSIFNIAGQTGQQSNKPAYLCWWALYGLRSFTVQQPRHQACNISNICNIVKYLPIMMKSYWYLIFCVFFGLCSGSLLALRKNFINSVNIIVRIMSWRGGREAGKGRGGLLPNKLTRNKAKTLSVTRLSPE